MEKKVKITAFLGIFEQKVERLIKDIKKHRKNPDRDKDHIKKLLKEAKSLRDLIRSAQENEKQE